MSHKISPFKKIVSRGDTTVMDAYLSPHLDYYIQNLNQHLPSNKLLFMQSNGGLIQAKYFKAHNSIFSGPAAGAVGMIETAKTAGFNKVIGINRNQSIDLQIVKKKIAYR